jgi:hypothetical protein
MLPPWLMLLSSRSGRPKGVRAKLSAARSAASGGCASQARGRRLAVVNSEADSAEAGRTHSYPVSRSSGRSDAVY